MKNNKINFSWPATLSDFKTDTANENFSRGKLKVFYKGETADHRYFSDDFSDEVILTLPYTPVVSYYDEEKDDFVGHATEQQILGIVDPCREPSFEEDENGIKWCVCDVVLYTERPDKVGDIAKKVEGHSQSLELDPSSVKYQINYDERHHFKNIEFTAGKFVGVSVLGSDQKPAFTGSSFFSCDEHFETKMKELKDYCEANKDQNTKTGGKPMNLQEFMKLSWGDISSKVSSEIEQAYAEEAFTYVVDMFEDSAVIRFYSYIDGSSKLLRVQYTVGEDGAIVLGNANEVHIVYEDIPAHTETDPNEEIGVGQAAEQADIENSEDSVKESEETFENSDATENNVVLDNAAENDVAEEKTEAETEDFSKVEAKDSVDDATSNGSDAEPVTEVAQVENAQVIITNEESECTNEKFTQETNSSSTSLADSERAEFEALKKDAKIQLVSSYKGKLSDEEINSFMVRIDDFTDKSDLELELLKAYKEASEKKESEEQSTIRGIFSLPRVQKAEESSVDQYIRAHRKRGI